ncbi:hypothetical protein [Desulfopila aestuarii]|uniref:Uncharacterized protein n=1 Tax=Desulfopila aestuarii DSM 18488 TaxID=1121416 RepID=A0A1M7YME5_9BACT|nr:hypothetical protein [Desulfopila aestuarii]SHO53765.1 hypothetical protein SAMN02745220_05294 [Desulfopila aestuarii DSM 18488]
MDIQISLLALIVAIFSFALALARFEHLKKSGMRPVLVFSRKQDGFWYLSNVGNGSAINVVVSDGNSKGEWVNKILCRPLVKEEAYPLTWLKHSCMLCVNYSDSDGRKYHNICSNYINCNKKGHINIKMQLTSDFYLDPESAFNKGETNL